jgi:ubiquinone/menaquinone biosynthesis C-methylase UbiE
MLEAGQKAAVERGISITFIEGDADQPPFPKESFDVVSSRFVVFTLAHPGYAIRRWLELLRPDGLLVFIGHDHPSEPRQHHRDGNHKWNAPERHREALSQLPFVNHTSKELSVVMEAVGLRDIRRVAMDKVVSARAKLKKTRPESRPYEHVPFILVGRK